MSLVGPRPERPEFIQQLQREIPFYRTRLMVKPSLTGWAQVRYNYSNTLVEHFQQFLRLKTLHILTKSEVFVDDYY